jgi:hypothetical protein
MTTQIEEPKSPGNKNPLTKQLKELRDRIDLVEKACEPISSLDEIRSRIEGLESRQLEKIPTVIAKSTHSNNGSPSPLLVVLPYHAGDLAQAKTLLDWCSQLQDGQPNQFPALLVADSAVPADALKQLHALAKCVFATVRTITTTVTKTGVTANQMFLWASHYIHDNYRLPFLWLEPDCVPLAATWLNDIASAYAKSPMRYLGAVIEQTGQANMPAKHLTGCSVYPNDAWERFSKMKAVTDGTSAWDIAGGLEVAESSQDTPLIQHFWGPDKDGAPVFVAERKPDSPQNHVMLDFIKPGAVLFHRVKGDSLINLLRQKQNGSTVVEPAKAAVLQD